MLSLGATCRPWAHSSNPHGGRPFVVTGWDSLVVVIGLDSLALVFIGGIHHHWAGFAPVGRSSLGRIRQHWSSLGWIRQRWSSLGWICLRLCYDLYLILS